MNKLKKTLALLLSLVMILSLLPAAAFAVDELEPEEEISELVEEEAQAAATALPAAVNGVITLTEDVELAKEVTINETVVIDLNGYHIDAGNNMVMSIGTAGEVTIKDSREGGYIYSGYTNDGGILVQGSISLESGEIRQGNGGMPFGFANPNASLSISGGKVTTAGKLIDTFDAVRFSISGGQIEASDWVNSYWPVTVNGNVTGGTFNIDPTAYVDTENYEVINSNGTYTVQAKAVAEPVAQIGDEKYETLEAAVAAVENNETITLVNDITFASDYSVQVWGDKYFNLDLNGHTITTNSGVGKDLSNMGYTASALCFAIGDKSTVTVSNGSIVTAYGAGVYAAGTPVTLEDLTITASTVGVQSTKEYSSAVRLTSGATVVINSGSYSGANGAYAIAVSNSGGEVTVNGGTFNGDIFFSTGTNQNVTKAITINGGNFAGSFVNTNKGTLVITGGHFTADPTAYVPEGYEVVSSTVAGYTYTVQPVVTYVAEVDGEEYTTLAAAFAAANATEGEVTITLLRNYDMEANEPGYGYTTSYVANGETTPRNNMIEISDGVTFDLDGHTLSNLFNNTFAVTGDNVTIKNGTMNLGQLYYGSYSAKKGVTLYAEPTYGSYIMYVNGAQNLTIDSLTTFGGINVAGGSTATINDLSFSGLSFYAVCSQGGSVVTLNGGSYDKGIDGAANYLFWVEKGSNSTLNITNGTYTKGSAKFINGVNPVITGGIFDFDPTNSGVAEGYEAVEIVTGAKWQVGKIQARDLTNTTTTQGYDATYTATKQVISTDGASDVLASDDSIKVNIKASTGDVAAKNLAASYNLSSVVADAIKAADTNDTNLDVDIQIVSDNGTTEGNTITYEVHPEAIVTAGGTEVGTFQVSNSQLSNGASFTITLPVPTTLAAEGARVDVAHKHENGTVDNYGSLEVTNGMVTIANVTSFSEFSISVAAGNLFTDANGASIQFMGGSLRRRVVVGTEDVIDYETDIRFGYTFTLPEGAELLDGSSNNYFTWGTGSSTNNRGDIWMQKKEDKGNNTYVANLVVNKVTRANYGLNINTKLTITYEYNGHTYTLSTDSNTRSVEEVCDAIKTKYANDTDNTWYRYAQYLMDEIYYYYE